MGAFWSSTLRAGGSNAPLIWSTTHVLKVDTQPTEYDRLEGQLRSFWELESLGISETEKTMYDEFLSSVASQDGRYQVSLLWKEPHDPLPDNYQLSRKRLQGLTDARPLVEIQWHHQGAGHR